MVQNKKSLFFTTVASNFLFIVLSIVCIAPILLLISISLSDNSIIITEGYSFVPQGFNLEAYKYILKDPWQIINAYKVTIIVTTVGSITSLLLTILLAYPISRTEFKISRVISFMVFFTMLFSGGLVPSYILITRYLKLGNTLWALILPLLVTPWFVILMKAFFINIPNEIIEAATIDGASEFRILFNIIVPLSKPALATIGLFIILRYFNDWTLSMLYIEDSNKISLQYFLYRTLNNIEEAQKNRSFMEAGQIFPQEPVRMTMAVLTIIPIMIVFPFLQQYFVKGITIGSVKG